MLKTNEIKIGKQVIKFEEVANKYTVLSITNNECGFLMKMKIDNFKLKLLYNFIKERGNVLSRQPIDFTVKGVRIKRREYTMRSDETEMSYKYIEDNNASITVHIIAGHTIIIVEDKFNSKVYLSESFKYYEEVNSLEKFKRIYSTYLDKAIMSF